jgi:hypothetical protein
VPTIRHARITAFRLLQKRRTTGCARPASHKSQPHDHPMYYPAYGRVQLRRKNTNGKIAATVIRGNVPQRLAHRLETSDPPVLMNGSVLRPTRCAATNDCTMSWMLGARQPHPHTPTQRHTPDTCAFRIPHALA